MEKGPDAVISIGGLGLLGRAAPGLREGPGDALVEERDCGAGPSGSCLTWILRGGGRTGRKTIRGPAAGVPDLDTEADREGRRLCVLDGGRVCGVALPLAIDESLAIGGFRSRSSSLLSGGRGMVGYRSQ